MKPANGPQPRSSLKSLLQFVCMDQHKHNISVVSDRLLECVCYKKLLLEWQH